MGATLQLRGEMRVIIYWHNSLYIYEQLSASHEGAMKAGMDTRDISTKLLILFFQVFNLDF